MSDKLQQVTSLINNQKYKKALTIVKKYNSKLAAQSFISLEAEGVCLYHLKKYVLAEMAFSKSLKKASNEKETINALANLKSSTFFSNKKQDCIEYLKQIIAIDPSINTAKFRFELCKLSFLAGDFNTVVEYVDKLAKFSEYSIEGGILAIQAYAHLADQDALSMALVKLLPEIDQVSNVQLDELLSTLYQCEKTTELKKIMALIEDKFLHQKWFQDIQASVNSLQEKNSSLPNQNANSIASSPVKPSQRIVGKTEEIVATISQLVNTLEEQGSVFHNELYFIENDGDLSIQSFAKDDKTLMSVPLKCMPLLSDFQLSLDQEKIVCTPQKSLKNPFAEQSMHLLIQLYNQTSKVSTWINKHPFLALRHEAEFLNKFLLNLAIIPKILKYKEFVVKGDLEPLFLKTFIGSREFDLTKEALEMMQIKSTANTEYALLSVIDFLNHSSTAPGYVVDKQSLTMHINGDNSNTAGEVFVKYNHIDLVLTYFIYGFVDKYCPILYSCKTNLTCLNGKTIQIAGGAGLASEVKEKSVTHLQNYLPASMERSNNMIKLNSLIIPNSPAIHTLKQVLKYILLKFDTQGEYQDESHLDKEIIHLERQLIVTNLGLWKQHKQLVHDLVKDSSTCSTTCKNDLQLLTKYCVAHIENYMTKGNVISM